MRTFYTGFLDGLQAKFVHMQFCAGKNLFATLSSQTGLFMDAKAFGLQCVVSVQQFRVDVVDS